MNELLRVEHLRVSAGHDGKDEELVSDASFTIGEGECVVLLGESGCGKTLLSRALTQLLPAESRLRVDGSVHFRGRPLHSMKPEELRALRRNDVRYVFQDPVAALNPVASVRTQLVMAGGAAISGPRTPGTRLSAAGIPEPDDVLDLYPHQLSRGQAQRVMIAMALSSSPALLIADEPTSALDWHLRSGILELLMEERRARGMSLLLITHELDLAQQAQGRILVMHRGMIVESAPSEEFFERPLHPYARLLLSVHAGADGGLKQNVAAESAAHPAARGCRFAPWCSGARELCRQQEPIEEIVPKGRMVRCHYWK